MERSDFDALLRRLSFLPIRLAGAVVLRKRFLLSLKKREAVDCVEDLGIEIEGEYLSQLLLEIVVDEVLFELGERDDRVLLLGDPGVLERSLCVVPERRLVGAELLDEVAGERRESLVVEVDRRLPLQLYHHRQPLGQRQRQRGDHGGAG